MADPDMAEIMGLMQRHMHVISTFEQEAAQEAQQEPSKVNILMATFWHHTQRCMSHGATREEAFNLTVQSCSTEQLQDLRNALDNAAAEEAARDHAVHGIQPEDFMYQDSTEAKIQDLMEHGMPYWKAKAEVEKCQREQEL